MAFCLCHIKAMIDLSSLILLQYVEKSDTRESLPTMDSPIHYNGTNFTSCHCVRKLQPF